MEKVIGTLWISKCDFIFIRRNIWLYLSELSKSKKYFLINFKLVKLRMKRYNVKHLWFCCFCSFRRFTQWIRDKQTKTFQAGHSNEMIDFFLFGDPFLLGLIWNEVTLCLLRKTELCERNENPKRDAKAFVGLKAQPDPRNQIWHGFQTDPTVISIKNKHFEVNLKFFRTCENIMQ